MKNRVKVVISFLTPAGVPSQMVKHAVTDRSKVHVVNYAFHWFHSSFPSLRLVGVSCNFL